MDENDQEVVDDMQGENYQEEYSVDRSSNVSGDASPRSEDGEVASNSPIRSPDNEYPGSPNNDEFENPDDQQLNASKSSFTQEDIGSPGVDNPSSPVSPGAGADCSRSGSPFDGNAGPYSPNSPVDGGIASPHGSASPQSPVPDDGIASPESPRQHGYSPRSPVCSIPHSPLSAASSNRSRRSQHSVLNEDAAELHQQSSPAGELNESHDRAESPAENRSRSASPNVNRSRSWSRSLSGSRNSSSSPAREGSAHSRSPAGSPARSHNSSPPRSPDGSPSRNQSSLPAGSPVGSPIRSRSGSPVRSRSVSPVHSRSVSPVRSRSGSSARSRSGSQARSRSGSPARSRSRSGSPARSRSVSPVRSKSGSPARSGSGSPVIQRKKRNRLSGSDRSRSNSPGVASNRSQSGSPERSSKKGDGAEEGQAMFENDSDNEGSDKGSAVGELIADIFGSSDEEEFEGFGNEPDESAAKKDKKKKPKDTNEEVLPDLSDDDGDVDESGKRHAPDFVSDFDLMLERKKEEMRKRRRKRKDVDIINDNDDLIDDMIRRMKVAAEDDRNLNQQKKPAVKKLGMLPKILPQLKKADLHNAFLDGGILNAITEWLAPLPDKSLPHLQIREAMLRQLMEFPTISSEGLKMSGVGKAVMYLYKHPREIRTNKEMAGKLINEWSRPIFNLTSNYKNLSRQEREERDYEQLPKKRRISLDGATPRRDIDKALAGDEKVLRPGDPGYVYRARVPQPSVRDYVIRPKWNVEEKSKAAGKKQITKYEKHVRAQKRKSTTMKVQRAVPMSIEGRNMSL